MPVMFKLMDVRPDFRPPRLVVNRCLAASGASCMEPANRPQRRCRILQLNKHATDFCDLVAVANHMFVAKQKSKAEFVGFNFGLRARVERAVLRPQLLG